jgi:nucleotide-binding universal stress UspA family protein
MAEPPNTPQGDPAPTLPSGAAQDRIFLIVVDDSEEMRVALRYAARRAQHTGGRVALLYVIEPTELQQWMAVETLMREEQREQAEALLQKLSAQVLEMAGTMPILYIREGRRRDELLELLDEEPGISILVLAASASSEGPGPLITALAGKLNSRLRIPMTIVPGNLTNEQIDALS